MQGNVLNFLLIWANMDYVHLYISKLNKVYVLKSPARVDFALVTSLNPSEYSNGCNNYDILIHMNRAAER